MATETGLETVTRRALDIGVSAAVLTLSSPVMLVAVIATWLEDRGPVLYRRRVLGLGGQEFDAFKVRTMRTDAEQALKSDPQLLEEYELGFKLRNDPRITRTGRFLRRYSIDELPQLINILRGQMTLVGPRMLHPPELARFGDLGPELLSVKPGLTGLWQISGRQDLTFDERLQLDRRYLESRSLRLDLKILLRTLPAVLRARGAY